MRITRLSGNIIDQKIRSRFLHTEVAYSVYLPPNYSELKSYEVLYVQDGADYIKFGQIARQAEELIITNEINEIIIVLIPYPSVKERWERYHPNGKRSDAYIRFFVEELVTSIDNQYSTITLADGRTLIGDSLGGTVSFMTALLYPHTFSQVIMQSPLVNEAVIEHVSAFPYPEMMKVYHIIGTEETNVKTTHGQESDFLTPNRELHHLMREKGFVEYFYDEFAGGHIWRYWQQDIKRALRYMFANE